MDNKKISKKGQIDLVYLPIIMLVTLITFLFLGLTVRAVYPPLITQLNLTNTTIGARMMQVPSILNNMVWGTGIIFFILFLGTAITTKFYPIYLGISILMIVIAVIMGGLMGEVMNGILTANNTYVNGTIAVMPAVSFIGLHMPMIILVIGVFSLIFGYLMLHKPEGGIGGMLQTSK